MMKCPMNACCPVAVQCMPIRVRVPGPRIYWILSHQESVGFPKSFVFLLQISHLERGSLRSYQGSGGGRRDCLYRDRHLAIAIMICSMHNMHSFYMHSRISIYKSCLFLPFRSHDLWSCASYRCADVYSTDWYVVSIVVHTFMCVILYVWLSQQVYLCVIY